ncbi:MAG: hypothetical protein BGO67_05765 [Alphaproteobacteria bacterium 41-28]|nr:MAG: hypothetical protein BGO67_05765 [Alphaproteobacteria bacterium 41-28]
MSSIYFFLLLLFSKNYKKKSNKKLKSFCIFKVELLLPFLKAYDKGFTFPKKNLKSDHNYNEQGKQGAF